VGIRLSDHATLLYPEKLAPTSPISGSRSVGIVHSLTQDTEFVLFSLYFPQILLSRPSPLSLVRKTEQLLGRKSSGSGLERGEYGRRDPSR
jgi:hypothetical protein